MGSGEFMLSWIMKEIKCPICPDIYKAPGLIIKEMKLVNCYWKYKGNYRGIHNTSVYKSNEKNVIVNGSDNSSLYKVM